MAERIKQIARENKVPVIEDKPLARALFSRPIGAEVPAHLYRAVARLLVLVHQARFGVGARPAGSRRPVRGWAAEQNRAAATGLTSRPWWVNGAAPGAFGAAGAPAVNGAGTGAGQATDLGGATAETRDVGWREGLGGEPDPEVDEEALARAIAEDELRDVTPQELADLEAGLAGGEMATDAISVGPEPATETDVTSDDEDQKR